MKSRRSPKAYKYYDSGFEEECGPVIKKHLGLVKNTETRIPYHVERKYIPDWIDDDIKLIIEAKGYFPQADRSKMVAVKADNPEYRIILLFQNPHCRLNKKSKTEYWQWAEKHGFEWGYLADVIATIKEIRKTKNK